MLFRSLIGPVTSSWLDEFLPKQHAAMHCLAFNTQGKSDLNVEPTDSWESFAARLPDGWQANAMFLYLQYRHIPDIVWTAPVPIIALAGDWNLQWHAYRHVLRKCDCVLTDIAGVEMLRREGIEHARPMNLFGLGQKWLEHSYSAEKRDIDVLFVGNLHSSVQRERLPILAQITSLRPQWNIVISSGVFGEDYRKLMARSRVVFNRSIRGEWNMRASEAIAAGALLFQEADNREVPRLLRDRYEVILYSDENLLSLLTHYLCDENERQAIVGRASCRLEALTFAYAWEKELTAIQTDLPALRERGAKRLVDAGESNLQSRVWVSLSATFGSDVRLRQDLAQRRQQNPRDASVSNLAGVLAMTAPECRPTSSRLIEAAHAFQDGWCSDPRHIMSGLNLTEVLLQMGQRQNADEQARRTLAILDGADVTDLKFCEAPHAGMGFDELRVEWERAAWRNAGNPHQEMQAKAVLVRWRLHRILAELHDDLVNGFIAASLRPDLAISQAWLGCALARKGRVGEAVSYLREALRLNPFDNEIARALGEALRQTAQVVERQQLTRARRKLSGAAPALVPREEWFVDREVKVLRSAPPPFRVAWQGSQEALHSLALVNRELCTQLIQRGHAIFLLPAQFNDPPGERVSLPTILRDRQNQLLPGTLDATISHQWPPNFNPPASGHWIMIQPWEFGSLPKAWLAPMTTVLDDVWVPSHFVRECYVKSGVPEDRVHVVPNGVGGVYLRDDQVPYMLKTGKRFKFLFVGGTIERKGIDILLKAYSQTFSRLDDVCLVVKDMGVATFYQGQTAEALIAKYQRNPEIPEMEYIHQELSDEQMASLYSACDCLVHPYRGEGFGLPIVEAMACGLPVIVTGHGAALDFCHEGHAYLIPARIEYFPDKRVGDIETVDRPWWAQPESDWLRYRMRHVVEHPEEAKAKGALAREFIAENFTWPHAAAVVEQRLAEVIRRPLRREIRANQLKTARPYSATSERPTVSLTMIVRNEEANLEACLQSIADLVQEIILVDTGSTDRTKEIAQRFNAKVFDFPWIDHFSAARNEALRHATGEWIFWMDADDRIDEENRKKLHELFEKLPMENIGFVMKCLCLPDIDTGTSTVVDHVRLFRNHPEVRWTYRIHEQILPAIRRQGGDIRWSDITIHHVGYQNSAIRQRKLERDLRLLSMEHQDQPDDPFTNFNLASVYQERGQVGEALALFRRSLERSAPGDSIVRKLYAQIIQCQRQLQQAEGALKTCDEARRHYPHDLEILFQEALTKRDLNDRCGAIACLERLLEQRDTPHFASIDTGLRGYKTRHNLAVFLNEEGRREDAAKQWRLAVQEQPNFVPALAGLAEILLAIQDWPAFDEQLSRLRQTGKGELDADALLARKHLALQEYATARQTIERAIASHPQKIWPRVVLTHILLREGKDWPAAETALRNVLTLDPNHDEAKKNLGVLMSQQKQALA